MQEAKAASSLNHPSIVTIYDIGQAEGVDFISMECVTGKTLDRLISRHGMRLNEALKYAVQIADALARAHAAGIVHRDLKPGNIMVNEHWLVKVLDFGLAKLTETTSLGEDELTRTMRPTTEEGKIVGTVAYMSPEQAESKKVDARSDIFSFGSVLYEMVTGGQKRRRGSTLTHTCRPQQTSGSTFPRVIVRTRLIPVYATPLVPPPGFSLKARVVQAATDPRGWRGETIRTIGGTSGSFCWSPMQSAAESLRRLASWI